MNTPNDIEVLIHCQVSGDPHPRIDYPAVKETIERFLRDGIIESLCSKNRYDVTKKGVVWLGMILSTPYPRVKYIDPRGK